MRFLRVLIVMILCYASVSCNMSASSDLEINPFIHGGNERNIIVVISDIHLGADLSYAQIKHNLRALEKLLIQIKLSPNVKELVIAGDLLDEWFVPAPMDTYQGKDQANFVQRIATANKAVIDAFNSIREEKKILVTYVPGNHDLTISEANVELILPGINQARDPELGLGTYSPVGYPQIAIEHGHRYNFYCAPDPFSNQDGAPGTISPPGYFFSRIAALYMVQEKPPAGDSLRIVTPNVSVDESQDLLYAYWKVWEWAINLLTIKNRFDEKIIVTNIDGFTETYSVNDLIPYQTTAGGFIDVHLFNGIQDTWNRRQLHNRVAVNIPAMRAIANSAVESELSEQAKIQYFLNPDSDARIVVFGHTHVAKMETSYNHNGLKSIYVNSGSWTDHNSLSSTSMEFVLIIPQSDAVYSQTRVELYGTKNGEVFKIAADSLRL